MHKTMQAAVFHKADDLRVEEVMRPEPGRDEVLLQVHRCGICGTDSHIVHGRFPAPNLPLIIGHEFAGIVAAVGTGVTHVKEGDRATLKADSYIPLSMAVIYLLLFLYFKTIGGYKPLSMA